MVRIIKWIWDKAVDYATSLWPTKTAVTTVLALAVVVEATSPGLMAKVVQGVSEDRVSELVAQELADLKLVVEVDEGAQFDETQEVGRSPLVVIVTARGIGHEETVFCGCVAEEESALEGEPDDALMRAGASLHHGETDAPVASFSMIVEPGRFWSVKYCFGRKKLRNKPSVTAYPISLDPEFLKETV